MVIRTKLLLLISNHYRYPCYVEAIQQEKYDRDGCKKGRKRKKAKEKQTYKVLFVKSSIVKVRGAKCLNHNSQNVIFENMEFAYVLPIFLAHMGQLRCTPRL